jgi:hypothetical protein
MNKGLKISLIVLSVLIVLITVAGYVALKIFGEAFGADCEKSSSWTIGQYEIQEYKCLGWAGPHYYQLHLYKDGKEIAENGYKLDSCSIRFNPTNDLYLCLNICNNKVSELRPRKKEIDLQKVDSIIMMSGIDSHKTKKMTKQNAERFIKDWNKSVVSDYREGNIDSLFYPNYQYKIIVFEKGDKKQFTAFNFLVGDDSNWIYYIAEDSDKEYFNRLWK